MVKLKISQSDVVLIVLDFLRRSGLAETMRALEKETGLCADEWGYVSSPSSTTSTVTSGAGATVGRREGEGGGEDDEEEEIEAENFQFLRGLVLDGLMEEAERFLEPLCVCEIERERE